MFRSVDLTLSTLGIIFLTPVFLIVCILCFIDTGSPFYRQIRIGKNGVTFHLIKFRSMKTNTPSVISHKADARNITTLGKFLRRSKIDELPQLWNVLKGEMSLVGPRPGLPEHIELIRERQRLNVFSVRPGITGLSQIKNIGMSEPSLLAQTDAKMISELSTYSYFKYIFLTLMGGGQGDKISDL